MSGRVLIVDDDTRLSAMVSTYLERAGFEVVTVDRAITGLATARQGGFDALLLDVMLPDGDGFELCRTLRAESDVPILMLTARGDEMDRIIGLELGADDYLPKPFHPRELLARLKAVLRRARVAPGPAPSDLLCFGRLEIDRGARVVRVDGQPVSLTSHQYELLLVLAAKPGRVLSREQLMREVRGDELEAFDRSIDVHISRIRAAIEDDPRRPVRIKTVRGAGYVFVDQQP